MRNPVRDRSRNLNREVWESSPFYGGVDVNTVDRNLSFQQNLPQFDIAVIVLQAPSNRLADLKPLASKVLPILARATRGQVTIVSA